MRKEEQRYRKRLKTLFIIDFLIVAVPIIFFLVIKTSFVFGVLTNDTEYSDARYENVYIDLAEGEMSGENVARLGYTLQELNEKFSGKYEFGDRVILYHWQDWSLICLRPILLFILPVVVEKSWTFRDFEWWERHR